MRHAIKIEDLSMTIKKADSIVKVLRWFLLELGYSEDRIKELECRSRDGFIPFSDNKGGLQAIAFHSQEAAYLEGGTGFSNADNVIYEYRKYDVASFEEAVGKKYENWSEADREEFDESRFNDNDSTVMFGSQLILNSNNTLTILLDVCVKDAPYHRQYDDRIKKEITFKDSKDLKRKLSKFLKESDTYLFSSRVKYSF